MNNGELHKLQSLSNFIQMIQSRRNEMGRTFGTYGGKEECIQRDFSYEKTQSNNTA